MTTELDDIDGEVISVNSEPVQDAPEDRGDVVTQTDEVVEAAEAPAPEAHDEATKPKMIPKARFDEVNDAKKNAQSALEAANAEIARLMALKAPEQAAADTASAFDEDAKEQAYIDAMLEGDTKAAMAIRREINANLRSQAAQEVEQRMEQRQVATTMQAESNQALADFPYLDTPDGEYALNLIVSARNADIAKGVPAHLALRKAVAAIAPRFMPDEDTPTRVSTDSKGAIDTRTQDALRRGAADSNRQPPAVQGIGSRIQAPRINVESLDDDQFAALSTADKKRLRGD